MTKRIVQRTLSPMMLARLRLLLLYPVPHYTRWGLYPQAIIVVACLYSYEFGYFIPTVAIGFLAVVAAIMAVRADHFTHGERVVYVLIAFALFFVEMQAVYRDRDEHDRQQAELRIKGDNARKEEHDSFMALLETEGAIDESLKGSITKNQAAFGATISKANQLLRLSIESMVVHDFGVTLTLHLQSGFSKPTNSVDGLVALSQVLCRPSDTLDLWVILIQGQPLQVRPKLLMGVRTRRNSADKCRLESYLKGSIENSKELKESGGCSRIDVISFTDRLLTVRCVVPEVELAQLDIPNRYLAEFGTEIARQFFFDTGPSYAGIDYWGPDKRIELNQVPTLIDVSVQTEPPVSDVDRHWSLEARAPTGIMMTGAVEVSYDRKVSGRPR